MRMLPPTLKKGIKRLCCRRRTLVADIFSRSAASGIVSSAIGSAGPLSKNGEGSGIPILPCVPGRRGPLLRRALGPTDRSSITIIVVVAAELQHDAVQALTDADELRRCDVQNVANITE